MPTGFPEMRAMVNQMMVGNDLVYNVMARGTFVGAFATAGAAMAAVAMLEAGQSVAKKSSPKPKGVLDWMPED